MGKSGKKSGGGQQRRRQQQQRRRRERQKRANASKGSRDSSTRPSEVGHNHSHATAERWENRLVRISPSYGAHDYKYSAMDNYGMPFFPRQMSPPPHIMSSMLNSIYIPTVQLQDKPAAYPDMQEPFPELEKTNHPDSAFGMSPMDLHGISSSVRELREEGSRHAATIGNHGSESTQDDNMLDHDNISGSSPESGQSPHRGHPYDEEGIEPEGPGDPGGAHPYGQGASGHHPRFSIVSNHLTTPNHLPKSHKSHYELVVEDEKEDHKYWDVSGSRLSQWCLIRPQELLIFLFLVGLVGIVILLIYLVFLTPGTLKEDPSENNSTKPYYRLQINDKSQWLERVDLTEEVFGRRSKSRG